TSYRQAPPQRQLSHPCRYAGVQADSPPACSSPSIQHLALPGISRRQQDIQGWDDKQRQDRHRDQPEDDHQGQRPIEGAADGQGYQADDGGDGGSQQGPQPAGGASGGCFRDAHAFLEEAVHGVDHDDAVIDGDADERDQADHGEEGKGNVERPEAEGGADDGQRHGREDDEGLAETAEQDHQHTDYQYHRDHQRQQGRGEGLGGIRRFATNHGAIGRGPALLHLVQLRLHVSEDLADRAPLVLGHDRKRTLTADVGDGNGRLGLAGAEQLLHGYRASVLG